MAIKKSDLYSSIWSSCDQLRGGMDASQYKDYVLFMLFIKYISDKYANSDEFAPAVVIPKGAGFKDMVALKGKSDIGDKINKEIIASLVTANAGKLTTNDFPDFNDSNKLGEGQAKTDRLTNLIAIFEKPELDFSQNRAEHDDILGDAYEYLMRHFATQSGKSKGQFYTPAEVSRIMAKVIGISPNNTKASTTAYDPTCGSGSLLLKIATEAGKSITLEGQEKDVTTAGLARMNMIVHNFPTATISTGDTLASPKFTNGSKLRTYDYVVANPPFSDKAWSTGVNISEDTYQRFTWGAPPPKQGDYAYLLHIIRSMNSTGKAACILPHGVLFRGNAEAVIREQLVKSGYLKGIIGLPANLFYGTGIPACILVLDKENAQARKGIFMIDASKGFIKDGNKNRLREQDIHKIVDTFNKLTDLPRYARMVTFEEIANDKNNYNLNLPRYIDSTEPEDLHDITAHMRGGIPEADINTFDAYWQIMPTLRATLFEPSSYAGYSQMCLPIEQVKTSILEHPEFLAYQKQMQTLFESWQTENTPHLDRFEQHSHPKALIATLSENLLATFNSAPLIDAYDLYQHLMDYWSQTMQDDCYLIAGDGWKKAAQPKLIIEEKKNGKNANSTQPKITPDLIVGKAKYQTELIPPALLTARYYASEQAAIETLEAEQASLEQQMQEMVEEHTGEEGLLAEAANEKGNITKATATARLKAIKNNAEDKEEYELLEAYLTLLQQEASVKEKLKTQQEALSAKLLKKYQKLMIEDIKALVITDKWLATLQQTLQDELDRLSQTLTTRIRQLAERYATSLPKLMDDVEVLSKRVGEHLLKMGVLWK